MCEAGPMTAEAAPATTQQQRYGMTVPLQGPLGSQREQVQRLAELGYTDLWSAEGIGPDGFTPLILASQWAPQMRLGTAIIPAFTRGPALLAETVGSMAQAAPGRFVLGLGTSSNVIVENWNSIPFVDPYKRIRDVVAFLRAAMSGEKVTETYESFDIKGFRMQTRPPEEVPIYLAALREGMLRLAGKAGDGVILNWLSADDLSKVLPIVAEAAGGEKREAVARLFVLPGHDREKVLETARFMTAAYISVPVYRAFHEWMGRGDALGGFYERWEAGDRKGALLEIPEQIVDELVINGSWEECRAGIQRYFDAGLDTATLSLIPSPDLDPVESIVELAPRR